MIMWNTYKTTLLTIISPALALIVVGCSDGSTFAGNDSLMYEPPINGAWVSETGQSIDIEPQIEGSINAISEFPLIAFVSNPQTSCVGEGDATEMEYAGDMSANTLLIFSNTTPKQTCFEGTFTDLVTLELTDLIGGTTSVFTNSRIEVDLGDGIWESSNHGGLSLYMNQPRSVNNDSVHGITGCTISNGVTGNSFSGSMTGFVTGTRQRPTALSLTADEGGTLLFKNLEFIDRRNMEIQNSEGVKYNLTRSVVDTIDIDCP